MRGNAGHWVLAELQRLRSADSRRALLRGFRAAEPLCQFYTTLGNQGESLLLSRSLGLAAWSLACCWLPLHLLPFFFLLLT